jgi:ribosomal protein S18 acetylase RimI-like enzyme
MSSGKLIRVEYLMSADALQSARVTVRPAVSADLPEIGKMAGALVRFHHALDPRRFLLVDGVEEGYARFFSSQVTLKETVLVVAEHEHRESLAGYAYARLEPRDWNLLLDACGALHDIFVVETERRNGVARALLDDVVARLTALGAPRMVLSTATTNEAAHRLFERYGFRRTMIEMTRELP